MLKNYSKLEIVGIFIPRDTMIKIWKYGTSVGISRVLSGIDTSYDIINEEKRLNENFFISTEKRHISKLINYMCKLYTKDVLIPSSGKLYGVKGGLNPPEKQVMQYGELYKKIQDTHRLVDEETLVLRETESNNIINYVHNHYSEKINLDDISSQVNLSKGTCGFISLHYYCPMI